MKPHYRWSWELNRCVFKALRFSNRIRPMDRAQRFYFTKVEDPTRWGDNNLPGEWSVPH